jgi:alkylation response protein AidB-like acyl-CoA dehydrogenase
MQSTLYEAEHDAFRDSVRAFVAKHVVPFHDQWERDGMVDRGVWLSAGEQGLLGTDVPEQYGGGGTADFRYNCVVQEELVRVGASGVGFPLHNDVMAPYLLALTTDEQKDRWLPPFTSGELITAIAMTEPAPARTCRACGRRPAATVTTGCCRGPRPSSPTASTPTSSSSSPAPTRGGLPRVLAARRRAGHARLRARPAPREGRDEGAGHRELFFDEVRVPASNLVGTEGGGFVHLMENLPQERLSIAVGAVAGAEAVFALTLQHCKDATAFGKPIGSFQANRFTLAEMATELEIARTYVDRAVLEHSAGRFTASDAAMAKWWTTELQKRVVDSCVQLHGGYGYMLEFPVAKAYLDARVQTIYGGTTEVMKEIVGRSLGV